MGARVERGEGKKDGEVGPALVECVDLTRDQRGGEKEGWTEEQESEIEANEAFASEVLLNIATEDVEHDKLKNEQQTGSIDKSVGDTAPKFTVAKHSERIKAETGNQSLRTDPRCPSDGYADHAGRVEGDDDRCGKNRHPTDPGDRIVILGAAVRDHRRKMLARFGRGDKQERPEAGV